MAKAEQFVAQVHSIFNKMELECFGPHSQITLKKLYPGAASGEHLEIDMVVLVGSVVILIEVTTQADKNSEKIKKFINHCELVRNSQLEFRDRFALFSGIPLAKLEDFESISKWRYLYIGNSIELIEDDITSKNFPQTDKLSIYNGENWEYLKRLTNLIRSFARYEFSASLGLSPQDLDDESLGVTLTRDFLAVKDRIVSPDISHADLYVLQLSADELLRIARVLRYKGQPLPIEAEKETRGGYQRILIPKKLGEITRFINDNPKVIFPTSITLVLSPECSIENGKMHIPVRYASIDVIDGQHRLFAYANENISQKTREKARFTATAIKFRTNDLKKINRYAAKTFVDINSTHTKVKRALIDLISYDVLGDRDPRAIAAKVLQDCNSKPRHSSLGQIFQTSDFAFSAENAPPLIRTVMVIDELKRLFDINQLQQDTSKEKINRSFGASVDTIVEPTELVKKGRELLEKYFARVAKVFHKDWRKQDSRLMSARYVAAFVRLLRNFIIEGLDADEMENVMVEIKKNLIETYHRKGKNVDKAIAFDDKNKKLPTKRAATVKMVHEILLAATGK